LNYRNKIPIIDLFARPGGLGEGFMSLKSNEGKSIFDIKLSIEKNVNAHKTLALRSFFRQFDQERRVDNLKPPQNSHTPKQTPPIKGITKSPVRSMMILIYKGFGLVPTLWTWGYI